MEIKIDSETMVQDIFNKMMENVANSAKSQGLDEEEVTATLVLNKKKIEQEASNLAGFLASVFAPELLKTEESAPEATEAAE